MGRRRARSPLPQRAGLDAVWVRTPARVGDAPAPFGTLRDFLRARHTKKFVRGQQWKPTLLNRDTQKNWEAAGSKTATDKAHEKLLDIMANHKPEPLSAEQLEALVEETGANELMITTMVHAHATRARSYELLMEAWQEAPAGSRREA